MHTEVVQHLRGNADWARSWLFEKAFPLWSSAGVCPSLGFWEELDGSGQPITNPKTRVRVQARQTYVFAKAYQMGWQCQISEQMMRLGVATLVEQCQRHDGLYGFEIELGKGLTHDRASLYDSAFVLLAFSAVAAAGLKELVVLPAERLTLALESTGKRQPDGNGYFETLPASPQRSQNPHMHLFEAYLAAAAAFDRIDYLERCTKIRDFVLRVFFDNGSSTLREFCFPLGDESSVNRVEAGHHYEWTWLLQKHAELSGTAVCRHAGELFASALRLTEPDGCIILEHTLDEVPLRSDRRLWSLTEALKANLIVAHGGDREALTRAIENLGRIRLDHFDGAPDGGWLDCRTMDGCINGCSIPASTAYHIVLAFDELIRISQSLND
ncbi:MAG: hypothetical protein GC148_08945 [Hyphomonas sp.]|nr:hypothetical protein [Hyphomonas sp.]